jgi:murein DD-endopeptidase MepM/ murein hydrolase activator NlpD
MIAVLALLVFRRVTGVTQAAAPVGAEPTAPVLTVGGDPIPIPAFQMAAAPGIPRLAALRTIIPTRPRETLEIYTVDKGDSIFGIAKKFNVKPETILWSNYETLNDDPHMIEVGLRLRIPAVDGVLYKWKEGDTVEGVASTFKADPEAILTWPANKLDITNPLVQPETLVMVPGGQREFRQWVVPTIARGAAGVNKSILGPGSCDTGEGGAYGTGTFVWPAGNTYLSGNDFWSGHLAIDIAAGTGAPIYATDSGVVVYAGAISGGYGNMVMIDHGNGYQSLYAHLSQISTRCGASVYQGQTVGLAGSTGRSTGPHLHFEIRYFGSFVNPWQVLP